MSRLGQHDVGHEGVITGRDDFSLRSSIANPRGVAQSPLQSTLIYSVHLTHNHHTENYNLIYNIP
ncbi:hypothetical protein [Lysinibacillus sp. NPDC056232]|uniref:hypothetical protein n=1 Tax=Lysinibacillus sp. NPDC056232 TaxID=3345756 RepID=UPI0035D63647